jgi:hypothetical protein
MARFFARRRSTWPRQADLDRHASTLPYSVPQAARVASAFVPAVPAFEEISIRKRPGNGADRAPAEEKGRAEDGPRIAPIIPPRLPLPVAPYFLAPKYWAANSTTSPITARTARRV